MFFASLGMPPEDAGTLELKSLRGFVDLQGTDPKNWLIKPYCPHCKIVVDTYSILGALGWPTAAGEVTEHAAPGFHHPDHAAKPDCPHSFVDDPRFENKEKNTGARRSKIKRVKKILNDPVIAARNHNALIYLVRRLTGKEELSRQDHQMIDVALANAASIPGIDQNTHIVPFVVAEMLGSRLRRFGNEMSLAKLADALLIAKTQEMFGDPPREKSKPKGKLHEVVLRNFGTQPMIYMYKGTERQVPIPQVLRLCFVNRDGNKVSHNPVLRNDELIDFPITLDFVEQIAAETRKQQEKLIAQAELAKKLPGYKGRPASSWSAKISPGQQPLL